MKLESVPDVSISIKNTFIEVHDKSDDDSDSRAGLRGGGGVGMGVSGMVFVGLVLGCIEAKFCK